MIGMVLRKPDVDFLIEMRRYYGFVMDYYSKENGEVRK